MLQALFLDSQLHSTGGVLPSEVLSSNLLLSAERRTRSVKQMQEDPLCSHFANAPILGLAASGSPGSCCPENAARGRRLRINNLVGLDSQLLLC